MDVLMPQLGETVSEGKIVKWFKAAGDRVKLGDTLFEIETDKVSMEVPATVAGVLAEIRVPVGDVAPVGAVVAVIGDKEGASQVKGKPPPPLTAAPAVVQLSPESNGSLLSRARSARQPSAQPAPIKLDPFFEVRTPERNYGPARLAGGIAVTPLARRLASEAGIDLARVTPSGPHREIVARDIESARRLEPPPVRPGPTGAQVKALYRDVPSEEVPLDNMRRTIATRLADAKREIPHFYLTADIEIGRLLALREEANAAAPKDRAGERAFRLSVNDFIIKAWAAALQRVPASNAVWAGDRILRFQYSDIGVAVASEGGLVAPVIRRAETKTLSAISAEMRELAERARLRGLKPHEYQGGVSAISNLGMYGVREFAAIINPPHSSILAVGAARRQAVERGEGGVAFASMMTVTLSCDHRVIDGALGAELLTAFRGLIEQPAAALV